MFKNVIVRTPCPNVINGISDHPELGIPDYDKALKQHESYIEALKQCGVEVTVLPATPDFPDSCFVEDVAVLSKHCAVITNPGATSRKGEVDDIVDVISKFYPQDKIFRITAPATLEGGDVMMCGDTFFVGLSARSNTAGVEQLRGFLQPFGCTVIGVEMSEVLHLKTGSSYLENNVMLTYGELTSRDEFKDYKKIVVPEEESYCANCIWVNDKVIVPMGYSKTLEAIKEQGYEVIICDSSEYKKIDGGLSCLSLRF